MSGNPRAKASPRPPRWLAELLPERVHPASAAYAEHDPQRVEAEGAPRDPRVHAATFLHHAELRRTRARERARRRSSRRPLDPWRVRRGLGERPEED